MSKHKKPITPEKNKVQGSQKGEAKFLGWQEMTGGTILPLYNIVKPGHPSFRSTVSDMTLQEMNLRIPQTPSPFNNVGPAPWHGISTALTGFATAKEAIEASGMDYTVVKKPLKEVLKLNHPAGNSDRWATVRTDNGEVLGIVGDSYEPVQNRDAFKFIDTLVGSNEAIYETAGVLGRGERIWILAKLPGYITVSGKDIVSKYLLLSNSHDGSSLVQAKLTPIRVVCNNTLAAALKGAGEITVHHTLNAAENIKQALSLMGLSNSLYKQLEVVFSRMSLTKITDEQLLDYVKALIPDNEKGDDNAENQAIRKKVLDLYESGQGADLARGTLWGAFNCVTEYSDYGTCGEPRARLESNWFGKGEQLKQKAFRLAERMM